MNPFLAAVKQLGGALVLITPLSPTDPGFGQGRPPIDPGFGMPGGGHPDQGLPGGPPEHAWWGGRPDRPDQGLPGYGRPDQGLPGYGHPGNALPIPPLRPSQPIVLPPGMWPPTLPPGANVPDNSLPPPPPGHARPPIVIPPDPDLGIEQPIYLPELTGSALLIAIPQATPKADAPPNAKPAILVQSGKKPVLVYVTATPAPK